jgi:DNA-binding response OmpR family regulator
METILVVDDDQVYLDLLKLNLESYGYRVVTAGSGTEAWSRIERDLVDLIVLDVGLPLEDGHAFARRLRAEARLSSIPVVYFSGLSGADERAKALETGADDFISKPCNPVDLVVRLRGHLKRRAWQKRLDESLARIQAVEQNRDELLSTIVHEIGGLASAVEAELRQGDAERAAKFAGDIVRVVEGVRARHGWRRETVAS